MEELTNELCRIIREMVAEEVKKMTSLIRERVDVAPEMVTVDAAYERINRQISKDTLKALCRKYQAGEPGGIVCINIGSGTQDSFRINLGSLIDMMNGRGRI